MRAQKCKSGAEQEKERSPTSYVPETNRAASSNTSDCFDMSLDAKVLCI
jgi:hypothetical protein